MYHFARIVSRWNFAYPPQAARFTEWLSIFVLDPFCFVPLECVYPDASFYIALEVQVWAVRSKLARNP